MAARADCNAPGCCLIRLRCWFRLATTGQPQIAKVTIGGTFEAGGKYRIKVGDVIFGFDRVGEQKPVAILPLKMYVAAGSLMFFSGVGKADKFNSDATGSGLINMPNEGAASRVAERKVSGLFYDMVLEPTANFLLAPLSHSPASSALTIGVIPALRQWWVANRHPINRLGELLPWTWVA
jgi:hypothetical protein